MRTKNIPAGAVVAAKHHVASLSTWLAIETAYFAIQFALVGLAIGFVYSRRESPVLAST